MARKLTRAVKGSPFRHYDFVVGGVRYCGSTKKTVEGEAEKVARAIRRKALDDEVARRAAEDVLDMTWADAVASYREAAKANTSARTFDRSFKWLEERIGATTLVSRIDRKVVAKLIADRRAMPVAKQGKADVVSNATVNKEVIAVVRFVLGHVKDTEQAFLPREPPWRKLVLKEEPRQREMTIDEEMRLEVIRPDVWPIFRFVTVTGLRRETAMIKKDQVHWRDGLIKVVGKGRKPHDVHITPEVEAILKAAWDDDPVDVFTFVASRRSRSGPGASPCPAGERRPVTYERMGYIWREICEEAGVTDLHIPDLRKTCGARIVRATGDLLAASKVLNHASIRQTAKAYAHITGQDIKTRLAQVAADHAERRKRFVPDGQAASMR
ncbi:tyrosine-type recombinase/integrase [Methylobacterium sp. J-076]|uniref:tyrosine-type recombinase/integrase n=1 Tax=Methylobacterium sp. J-076 TaxID=2836655 RepID=UPI001FBA84A4|nr:tyrosine-type recombinase/integrase [Methylobacterium sp. J-076]MCJ2014203.1 tyrosine-type recombinase/integrase [Methylobacterium sp. J-076]